jgi:aspartate/methionine/tyrosine aminotransferase
MAPVRDASLLGGRALGTLKKLNRDRRSRDSLARAFASLSTSIPSRQLTSNNNMSFAGPVGSLPIPSFIAKRMFSQAPPRTKSLNIDNINPHVKEAKYAVRGELAIRSEEFKAALAKGEGKDLPFDNVIAANIGNPQQLDQKPITFFRQVLSLMENPQLLEHEDVLKKSLGYKEDVIERARTLLKDVKSVGAYSQSQGALGIRQSVADFIERRDGYSADPANIYLSAGASAGVNALLTVICASPNTGVLVPIPQYPLYTATLSLLNAKCVPYYLNEEDAWGTDVPGIREALHKAQKEGIDVRAVAVINPGNPTGASLQAESIQSVIELAAEENLVVLADEVYQTNVFQGEFHSFKKGLRDLQASPKNSEGKFDNVELASMHSVSKGMVGECGHRGGYYEMVGFDPKVSNLLLVCHDRICANISPLLGRRANLQVRQHHALPSRHRPMHGRSHGQPSQRRLSLLPAIQGRIRPHLLRPQITRLRPVRRFPKDGRRILRFSRRLHVPVPDHQAASEGDRRREERRQERGRLLLHAPARGYRCLHCSR